jgi:uncharacterized protein YjdB
MAIITATTKDGGKTATCMVTVRERIVSITIDPATVKLGVGNSITLNAKVSNSSATNQTLRWVSSDVDIVSVDKKGKITAKKAGNAVITVYAQDGSGAEATSLVEVVRPVTRITIDKSSLSLYVGDTSKLTATITPSNASYKEAKWIVTAVDNPDREVKDIILIDEDGYITALKEGTVMVYAVAQDSTGKRASCYVTVSKRVPATSIVLADKKIIMIQGEQRDVKVVLNPIGSTDGLTWSSDNSGVASVNASTGRIRANATGVAYITVMTDSGKSATIEVTVIGLNRTEVVIGYYERASLEVDGASGKVRWDVENPLVATISSNGEIISRGVGTTYITATVNGRKLTCKVTVVNR